MEKVREAAGRARGSNNLKQIGLGMHNHESAMGTLPAQDGKRFANDKGGLSWRVHILPYIEQDNLYRQFKFDELWDSENNKKLIPLMPKVYASPLAVAPPGETYYQGFVGRGAFFEPGQRMHLAAISDGLSNTIMAVEGGKSVIWTKPDDIPFDEKKDVDPMSLALQGNPRINVLMGDGSVRNVDLRTIGAHRLKAAITRAGGEVEGLDDPVANPIFPVPKKAAPVGGPLPIKE